MIRKIFIVFLVVLLIPIHAQQVCPFENPYPIQINQGDTFTIECSTPLLHNNCLNLSATFTDVRSTSQYVLQPTSYSPVTSFDAGTVVDIGTDDTWSNVIDLPFSFCFYGNIFDKLVIGDNGVISFNTQLANQACTYFPVSLPNTALYGNSIFGVYHDLNNDDTVFGCNDNPNTSQNECGDIRILSLGTAPCRVFVVNYNNINHFNCENSRSTTQIVLYESSNIIDIYVQDKPINCEDTSPSSQARKTALIGIQNGNGTFSTTPINRNSGVWSAQNEAYRFVPNGNSIAEIKWYDATNTEIGTGASVTVCPTDNTNYTAKIVYTQCDGITTNEFSDTVQVEFGPDFPRVLSQEIIVCDISPLGSEAIDLQDYIPNLVGTQTGLNVSFHTSLQDAHDDINAITPTAFVQNSLSATYFIRAEKPTCYNVGTLTLTLRETPIANLTEFNVCDLGNDGNEVVDLTQFTSQLIGTQTQVLVRYYTSLSDATNGINEITSFSAIASSTIIYVRMEYENTVCINVLQIPLNLRNEPTVNDITLAYCTGIVLNLNDYRNQLIGAQTVSLLTYYHSLADAQAETNPINGTAYNAVVGQNVYVRVENQFGCVSIGIITFDIFEFPTILNIVKVQCDTNFDDVELFDLDSFIPDMITPLGSLSYAFFHTNIGAQNEDVADQITNTTAYSVPVNTEEIVYVLFKDAVSGCKTTKRIRLVSEEIPEVVQDTVFVCDREPYGAELVDLGGYLNTITIVQNEFTDIHFYETEADALALTNELIQYNFTQPETILWVRTTVEIPNPNGGEDIILCMSEPIPITFIMEEIVINDMSFTICDNNNDGKEIIDLTSYQTLISSTADNFIFVYNGTTITTPNAFEITTNPQVIEVHQYTGDSQCAQITNVTFTFKPTIAVQSIEMKACDEDEDGIVVFNLSSQLTAITANFGSYQISYYEDETDANAGNSNQITSITNYSINVATKDVYIRFFDAVTGCYSVARVTLTRVNLPQMVTNNANVCDVDNDLVEVNYLLSQLNSQLIGTQTGITVTYYISLSNAQNGINAITNFTLLPSTILYVRLENDAHCSIAYALQFTFVSSPNGSNHTTRMCDNNNNSSEFVDLTSYNVHFIPNNSLYTFSYFTSNANATANINPIATPINFEITSNGQVIYVRIENSNHCYDIVTLTVNFDEIVSVQNTTQRKCDNDNNLQEIFDVTAYSNLIVTNPNSYTITYFTRFQAAIDEDVTYQITDPTNTVVNGNALIVYTRVENPISGCYSIAEIELIVDPTPKLIDSEFIICDNDFDGLYEVRLSDINGLVIENTNNLTFSYYANLSDAEADINRLPVNYTQLTAPFDIYVAAISANNCRSIAIVSMDVNPLAQVNAVTQSLTKCDDDYDGIEVFDLTQFSSIVTNETTPTLQYYPTFFDLQNGTNEILNPAAYQNYIPTQTIFVKVSVAGKCPNHTNFVIRVLEKPYDYLNDSYQVCNNGSIIISAETGMQYDIYLWNTGEQTPSISVSEPGTYSVVVTNTINGCSATFSTVITEIEQPIVTYTFTSENQIELVVNGSSSYVYSLDQVTWQASPNFTFPTVGIQTIYIKDTVSGCIFSIEVLMLDFNNVITPNGDRMNDVWTVKNLSVLQSPAKLEIYDRYGKLIYTQVSSTEFIWDGFYLGRNLHETSYWYSISLEDGRKYQGYIVVKNY